MSAATKIDAMEEADAIDALSRCCGSTRWARALAARRPFGSDTALLATADELWAKASRDDVLEAFSHHPRIGASLDALREKYASTAAWAGSEQASVASASDEVLVRLRDGNERYEKRFGYIFIVCATGKSATEMLALLEARLTNEPDHELAIARGEQAKITRIRLEKL